MRIGFKRLFGLVLVGGAALGVPATYAQEVERATQLPRNLRQLNETLEELTDVLSDMEQSMKAKP